MNLPQIQIYKNIKMISFLKYSFISLFAFLLGIPITAKGVIIIRSLEDFQSAKPVSGLKYVIKKTIDLRGTIIKFPENSKLVFENGNFVNGTIVGNNTKIVSKGNNIFANCQITGHWNVECAYSNMFDKDLETLLLLRNLSTLSNHVKLSANRDYNITAKGESVNLEILEAEGNDKPILQFHTIDPNINGLNICGNTIVLRNLQIVDDYDPQNDRLYGKNNLTIGNTIGISSPTKVVQSLIIKGCNFSGSTSSSYVASSQTKNCIVDNCSFSGYLADHAVYCSMKAESFIVKKCVIKDIDHTKGLFKIRSSKNAKLFMMDNVHAHNLNGYMANVSLLETPDCEFVFKDVSVTKDVNNNSIFYGFCLNDETGTMTGKRYNAKRLEIKNCNFEYGYNGNAIVYSGAGKRACIETINYYNSKACQSDFSGGISRFLNVQNCEFVDCCNINNKGIALMTSSLCIENTVISDKKNVVNNCLFLINYADNQIESIRLKNIMVDVQVRYLFDVVKGDSFSVEMNKCIVLSLDRDKVLGNPTKCKVHYTESKCKFNN